MQRLRGNAALAVATLALFVAVGGGYALGKGFVGTGDLKNQAVTNKKIRKDTIKGNRVDEASLSGAGTAQVIRQDTAAQVPAATTAARTVLTLQVPAGSYLITSKAVLAKGGTQDPVQCFLRAGSDQDRSLEAVDAANNATITNLLAHTFTSSGTVTLACDNPGSALLLVTNKVITAMPVAALKATALD
jgi:hypothetical protein